MARSNKPLIWLPFAVGGTLAAFVLPGCMLAVLLASTGVISGQGLDYANLSALAGHPLGKLAILVVLVLPLWHAAHRLRMTLQDLGVRRAVTRKLVARACYAGATVGTIALVIALWS